ncbi:MAG: hypothetical protein JST82_05095 [Bacteroidetes bacterium]|nr:hypothetical protein [Bacteroidota bacterium]
MEGFSIIGDHGNYIKLSFKNVWGFPNQTSWLGGYDLNVILQVKSYNFSGNGDYYTSTGEIYQFYKQLETCNESLSGIAEYESQESPIKFTIQYTDFGHVTISGICEDIYNNNKLKFKFESDQSFIQQTLIELKAIVDRYGDMKGIKK